MEKIEIGRIVSAVGIRGEVKILSYAEKPSRFRPPQEILVGEEGEAFDIVSSRASGTTVIVKLDGVADRNAAERLRGRSVYIREGDLPELPEGQYYVRDLIGLRVIDDVSGEEVGRVHDVLQNSAQDVYEISSAGGGAVILVPGVPEFIRRVDIVGGTVRIRFIEGLKP